MRNEDGSFDREVPITREDLAALKLAGAGGPPGVTKEEWEGKWWDGKYMDTPDGPKKVMEPRVIVAGKDFDIGDCEERDGILKIHAFSEVKGGETIETHLLFFPGEWTGKLPNVTVTSDALATLPSDKRPLAIQAGTLLDDPNRSVTPL